jgi:Tfp pilus assembly protein PilN
MMAKRHEYINLLPATEKKAHRPLGDGAILAALFALGWSAAFGWQVWQMLELRGRLATVEMKRQPLAQQLEMVRKELGIEAPLGQMDPERAALIRNLLGERVLWSEVFVQFSRIVPKGLWFDNLEGSTTGRAEVRIKGGAFNYLSIAEFMLSMEKSNYFEKPQLVYAQKAVAQGQDVVGFEIVSAIKRGGGVR